MQIKSLQKHSDLLGVVSAGLCLIHCIALPVFLLSTTAAAATLSDGLFTNDWHWLDYFFIGFAGLAVYISSKKSTSAFIKAGMWVSVIIFGVALLLHDVYSYAQYVSIAASVGLMLLHFINIRYHKDCRVHKVNA